MNSRRKIMVPAIVGMAALVLAIAWDSAPAGGEEKCRCKWLGVSIFNDLNGDIWFSTGIPHDRRQRRGSFEMDKVTFDPTMDGLFPGATLTTFKGYMEREGWNTWSYTGLTYGINEDHEILYVIRGSGILWWTDSECNTYESEGSMGIYSPDQDPFSDVEPAFGCWPMAGTGVRMPNVPPCEIP